MEDDGDESPAFSEDEWTSKAHCGANQTTIFSHEREVSEQKWHRLQQHELDRLERFQQIESNLIQSQHSSPSTDTVLAGSASQAAATTNFKRKENDFYEAKTTPPTSNEFGDHESWKFSCGDDGEADLSGSSLIQSHMRSDIEYSNLMDCTISSEMTEVSPTTTTANSPEIDAHDTQIDLLDQTALHEFHIHRSPKQSQQSKSNIATSSKSADTAPNVKEQFDDENVTEGKPKIQSKLKV